MLYLTSCPTSSSLTTGFEVLPVSLTRVQPHGCYECSPDRHFGHWCGSRRKYSYSHSVLMSSRATRVRYAAVASSCPRKPSSPRNSATSLTREAEGSPRYSSLACSSASVELITVWTITSSPSSYEPTWGALPLRPWIVLSNSHLG